MTSGTPKPAAKPDPAPPVGPPPEIRRAAEYLGYASNPIRLRILMLLTERARDVISLCFDLDGPTRAAISQHLKLLRLGRLVEVRRSANRSVYWLTDRGRELVKILGPMMGGRDEARRGRPPPGDAPRPMRWPGVTVVAIATTVTPGNRMPGRDSQIRGGLERIATSVRATATGAGLPGDPAARATELPAVRKPAGPPVGPRPHRATTTPSSTNRTSTSSSPTQRTRIDPTASPPVTSTRHDTDKPTTRRATTTTNPRPPGRIAAAATPTSTPPPAASRRTARRAAATTRAGPRDHGPRAPRGSRPTAPARCPSPTPTP